MLFFKALLFLSAASVISACHHEQNIFNMGGLRKHMPLVHTCFLAGGAALAALPVITVGFYSKEKILIGVLASGHSVLLFAALIGTFLTSIYTFRMIFTIFYGSSKCTPYIRTGLSHNIPLLTLLTLSTCIGAIIKLPLSNILPVAAFLNEENGIDLEIFSSLISLLGIFVAAFLYLGKRSLLNRISNSLLGKMISQYWFSAWGFDWLYNRIFIRPYTIISEIICRDPLSRIINMSSVIIIFINRYLTASENGYIRWYIASVCLGSMTTLFIIHSTI
jgi:NADH-quinone oxidoreductase subunit L